MNYLVSLKGYFAKNCELWISHIKDIIGKKKKLMFYTVHVTLETLAVGWKSTFDLKACVSDTTRFSYFSLTDGVMTHVTYMFQFTFCEFHS